MLIIHTRLFYFVFLLIFLTNTNAQNCEGQLCRFTPCICYKLDNLIKETKEKGYNGIWKTINEPENKKLIKSLVVKYISEQTKNKELKKKLKYWNSQPTPENRDSTEDYSDLLDIESDITKLIYDFEALLSEYK